MSRGRATARATRGLALIAALAGCSVALDFDDECSVSGDCAAGKVCESKYCVPATEGGDATVDAAADQPLVNDLCPQLVGATEAEVRTGKALLIGALSPRTGGLAATGRPVEQAIFLAVEELNQIGGIDGRKLAVLACDDGTSGNDIAENAMAHLVQVARVPAVVGPGSSSTLIEVFNTVAHDAKVALISPSATSPAITNLADDGLVWRTPPSDDLQGSAIVGYLKANSVTKIAVVHRRDAYGDAFRKVIQDGFCADGVCDEAHYLAASYDDTTLGPDQARALEDLAAFQPEVTVVIGFLEDGVAFLNLAAGESRLTSKRYILTDGMKEPPLVSQVESRQILAEMFGTAPASPDNPNYSIFSTSYRGRWGIAPSIFNAQAYDATYLLALAIAGLGRDAVPTGPGIAAQLKRMARRDAEVVRVGTGDFQAGVQALRVNAANGIDFEGASGPLDFNVNTGEAPADIEGWRVDAATQKIVSAGVIFTAAGEYRAPAPASAGQ